MNFQMKKNQEIKFPLLGVVELRLSWTGETMFGGQVLRAFSEKGNARNLVALDLDRCDSISEDCLYKFLMKHATQLRGLVLSGIPHLTDQLWAGTLPLLKQTKILVMGMPEGCCPKIQQKVTTLCTRYGTSTPTSYSSIRNPSPTHRFLDVLRGFTSLSEGFQAETAKS